MDLFVRIISAFKVALGAAGLQLGLEALGFFDWL